MADSDLRIQSLGFDSGATDQSLSAVCLLGASLFGLLIVYAVSKRYGFMERAMTATIGPMVLAGTGFAFAYAWQQHML